MAMTGTVKFFNGLFAAVFFYAGLDHRRNENPEAMLTLSDLPVKFLPLTVTGNYRKLDLFTALEFQERNVLTRQHVTFRVGDREIPLKRCNDLGCEALEVSVEFSTQF